MIWNFLAGDTMVRVAARMSGWMGAVCPGVVVNVYETGIITKGMMQ